MNRVTATAAALVCGLAASSASAQVVTTRGSDTLGPIMDYLTGCADDAATGQTQQPTGTGYKFGQAGGVNPSGPLFCYQYQGSGNGEDAILGNEQEWAPMSRFLETAKAGDGCMSPQADPAYAGCWSVAKDSLAVFGNIPQSCTTLTYSQNMAVLANGTGAPTGATYNFPEWRSVLRVIYGGNSTTNNAIGSKQCNSDLRKTLVRNWGNLFKGGCATGSCPSGLTHAWRRDDVSGTTAVFLDLLNLPGIADEPFCNGSDEEDEDPIRTTCAGTGFNGDGPTVCGVGPATASGPFGAVPVRGAGDTLGVGSLSLVLPTLIPNDPYGEDGGAPFQSNCGAFAGGGSAFGQLAWAFADQIKYGSRCPDGKLPSGGRCSVPKPSGASGKFGCVAGKNNRPAGTPTAFDARVYNLWTRTATGTVPTYTRGTQQRPALVSYYRAAQFDCTETDATGQIACFVDNDACAIGFGGRSGIAEFGVRGLGVQGTNGQPAFPTAADATRYPLARDLYFCQLDQFGATPGSQSATKLSYQETIFDDVKAGGGPHLAAAVLASGFFSVPSPVKTCCSGTYNSSTGRCQ